MDMTAAGELLSRGQPERAGHFQIAALAHHLRLDRYRRSRQRGHLNTRPARGLSGQPPAPAHLTAELVKSAARPRIGFQLLQLQLKVKGLRGVTGHTVGVPRLTRIAGRRPDGAQCRLSHRPRLPRARLDKQQLFLNTHAAHGHRPPMPTTAALIPAARYRLAG